MFTSNRAFFGLFYQSLVTKPALSLIFCASLCLSLASGYTTWDGMTEFTNSSILSFLMTAGLQGLMLVLAWIIGKEIVADHLYKQSLDGPAAENRTPKQKLSQYFSFFVWRQKGIILSFVLCAAVSVFFSFDSFFRNIYTDDQRTEASTTTARTKVQVITGAVETALKQASQTAQQDLIESKQWTTLKLRLNTLAQNTRKIEGLASLSQTENTLELAKSSSALKSAIRLKTAELKRFVADENKLSTSQTNDVERVKLETHLARLRRQQISHKKAVETLAIQIKDEIKNGQGERGSGCGPVCRTLQAKVPIFQEKLNSVNAQIQKAENNKVEISAHTSITDTALTSIRTNIGTAETAIGALNANLEHIVQQQKAKTKNVNFEDRLTGLTSAIAQFELTSDQPALLSIRNACTGIEENIKRLNIAGNTQKFSNCNISQVAAQVAAADFGKRIENVQAACRTDLSTLSFNAVLNYGRSCLQVANLGTSLTNNFQRQLDRIELEYSATAHPFERNLNAITSTNKLAILAAVLALLIDVLIFLTGIFGARQTVGILATSTYPKPLDQENAVRWALGASTTLVGDEDEETLKAKVFLTYLEPMAAIKDGFMCQINLRRVTPPYLELVNSVLNSGPFFERTDEPRIFLVSDTMYRHLTKTVFKFEEHRKYARGNSASASTARFTALAQNPHLAALQNPNTELDIARAIKSAANFPGRAHTQDSN